MAFDTHVHDHELPTKADLANMRADLTWRLVAAMAAVCAILRTSRPQAFGRYRSVSSTRSATRSAMASDAVSPGESIPAACTSRGCRRSRRIRKSENVRSAGAPRARIPLPPGWS